MITPLHILLSLALCAAATSVAEADEHPTQLSGLILNLDADLGVTTDDQGRVSRWRNQVPASSAQEFVQQDAGRGQPGSGRPTLRKSIPQLQGHSAIVFQQQELVCPDEDVFDKLTQGAGCTWLAVLAVHEQRVGLKDVNSFFGNLRNGGNYEGLWGCLSDDNTSWWGVRNGITFGRFDDNNPQVHGAKLEPNRFTILAGRMAAGVGNVRLEIFNNSSRPSATTEVPVNARGNPSKMAVGQERDAIEHPGQESFDGEMARLLIYTRPLADDELNDVWESLQKQYGISPSVASEHLTAENVARARVYENWPFDAAEAKRRQQETAEVIGQPIILTTLLSESPRIALPWRLIPAGKFMLGSPPDEPGHEGDERLRPEVISVPFYMMETQLTVEQYRALLGSDPLEESADNDARLPAGVVYREAIDRVLPALAKLAPNGWKVILPDHARLEYAARSGVATMNHGGSRPEDAADYAWTKENSNGKVQPVGQKLPNAWGLHDVIGNRWHWFWRAEGGYGNSSTKDHIVYGGTYRENSGGNGARLANIMISDQAEGVRFALIPADTASPKDHPETARQSP